MLQDDPADVYSVSPLKALMLPNGQKKGRPGGSASYSLLLPSLFRSVDGICSQHSVENGPIG